MGIKMVFPMLQMDSNSIENKTSGIEEKLEWIYAHRKFGISIRKVCSKYEISTSTYLKWDKRYDENGISGLIDQKRGPKKPYNKTSSKIELRIIEIATENELFDSRDIQFILAKTAKINISLSSIQRILANQNLNRSKGKRSKDIKEKKKQLIKEMIESKKYRSL